MGEQVKRPYREGVGVKPTSPKPTPGIMQTKKFEDGTTTYRVSCSCDSPDCDLNVWVEGTDLAFDAEYAVKIYAKARTPSWKEGYNRFKTAMKLLFTGEAEYETETLMTAEQAIVFADTIKTMVAKTEKERQALKKQKSRPVAVKGKPQ